MIEGSGASSRRIRGRTLVGGAILALALGRAGSARGQADLRDITQPIAVVNSGGHSAPVRAVVFTTPDGSQLLSGGLDKVVNVWSLGAPRPRLVQTIRPRLWRGYAGSIYALALSPRADARGQRLLAVAGIGVESNRGEIGLYRFPGLDHVATGEVDAQLPGGAPRGHGMSVMCLAFDPSGEYLASGSNDRTVRIWRVQTRTTAAVLSGHTGPVNALGYSPDGRVLVTGGADGLLKLWDVARGVAIVTARPNPRRQRANDPAGDAINALAVSPAGRWVVVGRENGDLLRYDLANLGGETLLPRGAAGQGAVETLAISNDGSRLVTSVVSRGLARPSDLPGVECDVELRSMPQGAVQARLARASNLVYACAFSPDGSRVAYAGGDTQAVTVRALADLNGPPTALEGQGSSVWDVGFARDGRTLGFSRRRPDLPGPASPYEDFDLQGKRVTPFDRGELSRAVTNHDGWTVRPVDPHTLDVLDARGQGFRLKLDPVFDRRWWAYSFIPAGAGHRRPTLAVGCEVGVVFFRLSDGVRTRIYAGHNGPVYALAPSVDGVWLATGSVDQTVRLWSLDGCDTVAPLGARFAAAAGNRAAVAAVEPRGFAEAMDLRAGDVVEALYIGGKAATDLGRLDPVPPNTKIEFVVMRQGKRVELITTKRNAPALTLFPALDREWVVWTPRGYYDTSAIGDRRYLGWHRNRPLATEPTDYFAFDNFEKELRKPQELQRLLQTGDPAAFDPPPPAAGAAAAVAVRAPEQVVAEDRLPRLRVDAPARPAFDPLVAAGAAIPLRIRADSEDGRPDRGLIRSVRVLVDSGKAAELAFNPPVRSLDRVIPIRVNPGPHKVSVIAVNDLAKERAEAFEVVGPEPPKPAAPVPEPEPPRLVVLTIGAGAFQGAEAQLPRIAFATEDARDVGAFLAAPGGTARYRRVEVRPLAGAEATTEHILAAFKTLDEERQKGALGQGDAVFVMIESHFLAFGGQAVLLGTDASGGTPPSPAVPAPIIAETLGQLADYGCTVMVLLDTLHDRRPEPPQTNRGLNEWTRVLYRSNVIAFVASIHGPGQAVASRGHRAFAAGILDALNVQGRTRLSGDPARPLTLYEFQDRVARNIEALTNRQQHARCYIPEAVPGQAAILDPPSRSQPRALRAAQQ